MSGKVFGFDITGFDILQDLLNSLLTSLGSKLGWWELACLDTGFNNICSIREGGLTEVVMLDGFDLKLGNSEEQ